MRDGIVFGTVLAALLAAPLAATQQPATQEGRAALERRLVAQPAKVPVVDARVTTGRPYSGDAVTEFVQVLPDGNRITRKTLTRTFRDTEGRTRREVTAAEGTKVLMVNITDPAGGTTYVLEPETRTAWKQSSIVTYREPGGSAMVAGSGGGRGGAVARTPPPTADERREIEAAAQARIRVTESAAGGAREVRAVQERTAAQGAVTTEDLGTQMFDGVLAEGTRTTTVIAAGSVGNEQPIRVVSEQWFSPDLQVIVMTKHSDPRIGENTYRLVNIVRGEPDRALFEVPAEYTMKEGGIIRRRQPQ
jgi:hypothetical protein